MTTDPNEGPVWPSENPSDRPTPSSEPVYPPSAANEPPPPPEQASPEPPGLIHRLLRLRMVVLHRAIHLHRPRRDTRRLGMGRRR